MPNNINEHDINSIREMIRAQKRLYARLVGVFGEKDEASIRSLRIYKELQNLFILINKKGDACK